MATQVLPGNLVCSNLVKLFGVTQEAPSSSAALMVDGIFLLHPTRVLPRTLWALLIDRRQHSPCPTPTCELQDWQVRRQLANCLSN